MMGSVTVHSVMGSVLL